MDIEGFYDAKPARRASTEVEYGHGWSDGTGRAGVSWVEDTGEVYAMTEPDGPIEVDTVGGEYLRRLKTGDLTVHILGTVKTRAELDWRLRGWRDAMPEPDSLQWVRDRLQGPAPAATGDTAPDGGADIVTGADDTPSRVITTFLDELRPALPESELARLGPLEVAAQSVGTEPAAEWHRALRAARWAADRVGRHGHLAGEARKTLETVKLVSETVGWELIDVGRIPGGMAVSPGAEAEIVWAAEAGRVAIKAAERDGWDQVPWVELVQGMLAVG